ncbi:MAG: Nif3-like dinuclear metal center hexameric protein [Spirochaetaceae bacterium]|jgi:dinuclear metal center YbgI/SA1388 family protein|nr:Nif3-like dinuclear metal center hexameric protein [Spirochaetaceae bacterium]
MIKSMNTRQLDAFFRDVLKPDDFNAVDSSLNGIQVDNDGADVPKIAFAVDACLETFKRAARCGAGMLFVHHGLFWGAPLRIEGVLRSRLDFLLKNNLALYAAHLPLDKHGEVGNNAVLAGLLDIVDKEPFGLYHGIKIGFKGRLRKPLTVDEAARRINYRGTPPLAIYPFGKAENVTCAVISGGAAMEAPDAVGEGIDLYVTGESSHSIYHTVLEGGLNMIAGGHYATEVWGVQKLMERCKEYLDIDAEFIDVPTGL